MPQFIKMGLGGTGYLGKKESHNRSVRKIIARRRVMPGFPITTPFRNIEDVREYLSGETMICLLCGKNYKRIGTHLIKIHGVTVDEYKKRYNIPWTYGLICQESSKKYSKAILKRMKDGWVPPFKTGDAQKAMINQPKRKTIFKAQIAMSNLGEAGKPKHPLTISPNGDLETFTDKRKRLTTKRGSKEFKKKMGERHQCKQFVEKYKNYWKGRKQSDEHIKKRFNKTGELKS